MSMLAKRLISTQQDIRIGDVIDGDIVAGAVGGFWVLFAPASKRSTRRWGLYGVNTELPGVFGAATPDPNSGTYNTDILIGSAYYNLNDGAGSTGAPAANYCRFSLSRPYDLPNKDELLLSFYNKSAIDSSDFSGGSATLSAISSGKAPGSTEKRIFSSTELSDNAAWFLNIESGLLSTLAKSTALWVLPVRRIPVEY